MPSPRLTFLVTASLAALLCGPAHAHPHVFAEAKMTLVVNASGGVDKLVHNWVFDDAFSSTVLVEFDKDLDLKLNEAELKDVQDTIVGSIGEYNYFQTISNNGAAVKMARPPNLTAKMDGTTLVISFDSAPDKILPLHGKVSFGIYDPTFYTAIDFIADTDLQAPSLPAGCEAKVIRPSPEEAMAQNQKNLTESFFETTDAVSMGQLVATRLEVTCPP